MPLYAPPQAATTLINNRPLMPNLALALGNGNVPVPLTPAMVEELDDVARCSRALVYTARQGKSMRRWVRRVKHADSRARIGAADIVQQLQQPGVAAAIRAALGIDALVQQMQAQADQTAALAQQMQAQADQTAALAQQVAAQAGQTATVADWADIDRQRRLNRRRMEAGRPVPPLRRRNRPFPANAGPAPRFAPDVAAMPVGTVNLWLEYYAITVEADAGLAEKREALVDFISLT